MWMTFPERGVEQTSWSHGNFWDARDMVQAFDDLGAVEFNSANLTGSGEPEQLDAVRVNTGFFRVLGVPAAAGRLFREGEDVPGQDANIVILSHRFWTRRFGRDPAIVGRSIRLDGVSHQVVGILPAGTPLPRLGGRLPPARAHAERAARELGDGRDRPAQAGRDVRGRAHRSAARHDARRAALPGGQPGHERQHRAR